MPCVAHGSGPARPALDLPLLALIGTRIHGKPRPRQMGTPIRLVVPWKVRHPRWRHASEELIGTGNRLPTQLFNRYAAFAAGLSKGLETQEFYT